MSNSLYKAWTKSKRVDSATAKGYAVVNRRNGADFVWWVAKDNEVISKPYTQYGWAERAMLKLAQC